MNPLFKFLNIWTKHKKFLQLVNRALSIDVVGSPLFVLWKKLQETKRVLKDLHRSHFRGISGRVVVQQNALHTIKSQIQSDPTNVTLQEQEVKCLAMYKKAIFVKKMYYAQRVKVNWITIRDTNNAFFHVHVKEKKSFSNIGSIKLMDETIVTNKLGIVDIYLTFYKNMLGTVSCNTLADASIMDVGTKVTQDDCIFF